MNLKTKKTIILPIITLFVCVSVGIALIEYKVNIRSLERIRIEREKEKFDNIAFIIKAIVGNHVKALKALAKTLQENKELSESLAYYSASGYSDPVNDVVNRFLPMLNLDIFLLTDIDGKEVVNDVDKEVEVYSVPGITKALKGSLSIAAEEGPEGWAIRIVAPLYWPSATTLQGTVVAGIKIGDKFAKRIAEEIGAEISFVRPGGEILASSAPIEYKKLINKTAAVESISKKLPFLDHSSEHLISTNYVPITIADEMFGLIIQQDSSKSIELMNQERKNLLWMLLVIVGLVLISVFWLAYYVVLPLRKLEAKTQSTINNFSGSYVYSGRGNEIDRLTESFDYMMKTLYDNLDALKQSEEKYRTILDTVEAGYYELDLEGNIIWSTEVASKILGSDSKRIIGKNYRELCDEKCSQDLSMAYKHVFESGETAKEIEWIIDTANGNKFYLEASASVIRNNQNLPIGFRGLIRDITKRKNAEEELKNSRRRLEEIIDFLPDPTWVIDNHGIVVAWNRAIEKLTGVKAVDILGKGDFVYAIPFYNQQRPVLIDLVQNWQESFKEKYVSLKKSGDNLISEEVFIPILGEEGLYLAAAARALYDSEGKPAGAIESVRDITERKKYERDLMTQKGYLEHLFEASTEAIALINENNYVERINSQFTSIYGFTSEEVIGKTLDETIVPSDKREEAKKVKNEIKNGKHLFNETVRKRKDGSLVDVSITGMPIRIEGNDRGIYVIYRDISDRIRAERALKEARISAETANRAKSDFLATMSHEIRTPMNSVLGFLGLSLEDTTLPPRHRRNLNIAHKSAKLLLDLLNDILDLSKLESGSLEVEEKPFNLQLMLEDTVRVFEIKAQEKGLNLELKVHPDLTGNFIADSFRLRQIILNLISNAIKFTDRGSVSLNVMPENKNGKITFAIEDTGIGIPRDRIDKVFESFTQAESSTSRRYGGTGLGTTISKQLVELMGGTIWAESEVGKGSTFYFTLPIKKTHLSLEEISDTNKIAFSQIAKRKLRILLAEDVEENITLAAIRLEQKGHEVVLARNGIEATDAFIKGGIDLILMDVHMPEMDGIEATRKIRQIENLSGGHIPIIATTASVMTGDQEICLKEGMDSIVGKPIDFEKLFFEIERLTIGISVQTVLDTNIAISPDSEFSIPRIEEVDVNKGINTWQNPYAYYRALSSFSNTYRQAASELIRFLNTGDEKSAYHLAHTIKGVAGNLCATKIYEVASKISSSIKEKRIDCALEMIEPLGKAIEAFREYVRTIEERGDAPIKTNQKFNYLRLSEIFKKMQKAFEEFNPDSIEPYLKELKIYLTDHQILPVIKQIEEFDFDAAKDEMFKLAKNLGIKMET